MRRAIDETNRRRAKQLAYNEAHGIQPVSIFKAVRDLTDQLSCQGGRRTKSGVPVRGVLGMPKNELQRLIAELEKQMKEAAKNLEFEKAAALRDQIYELRTILAEESNVKPWEKIRLLAGEEESCSPAIPRPREMLTNSHEISAILHTIFTTIRYSYFINKDTTRRY